MTEPGDKLWQDSPAHAGLAEALRYGQRRAGNRYSVTEAEILLGDRTDQVNRRLRALPDGDFATVGYRVIVLTGLLFFLTTFAIAIRLDYLIFRALHPLGTIWLPLGLACLAVIGITTGTVIAFGSHRHQLVPASSSRAVRNTAATCGALFAIAIAIYLATIAPYRSYVTGEESIRQAQRALASDQTAVPRAPSLVITDDNQAVSVAEARFAEAKLVDRLSAGVLFLLEIPLTEAAVLSSELLAADLAVRRRWRAQRRYLRTEAGLEVEDRRFDAELAKILVDHGHGNDVIDDIANRVRKAQSPAASVLAASRAAAAGSAGPQSNGQGNGQASGASVNEGAPPGEAGADNRQDVNTGSTAAAAPVKRYLVGKSPDAVKPGRIFSLIVSVSTRAAGSLLKNFAGGRDVALIIDAPGLRVLGEHRQLVRVPRDGDSEPVKFDLIGDDTGPRRVSVTAWDGGSYLGELGVGVSVDRDARGGPEQEVTGELGVDRTEGEVTLFVNYDPQKEAYRFQFIDDDFPEEVTGNHIYNPGPVVDHLLRRLNALASGVDDYGPAVTRRLLAGEGGELWGQLVPEKVRQQFWERQSRIKHLTILTNRDIVPWELLYANDGRRNAGFLVEQFPVTRAIFNHRRSERLRLRPAHFVLRPEPSSYESAEVERIAALLEVEPATTSELVPLLNLIDGGEFGLLHFACHNRFSREEGSSIMLDKPLTPALLSSAANAGLLSHTSPVVFINACSSLSEAPSYSQLDGWARKFMTAGAAACIGSLWDVSSEAASNFAEELYRRLLMGNQLGEAVMAARQVVADGSNDPTWLAYSVYGNPRARVSSPTSLVRA